MSDSMVADAEALLAAMGSGELPQEDRPQFDDTRRLDSVMAVAEALLDKYDDQHRVAAERFMAADEKTLKNCVRIRKKKEDELHQATEQGASKEERGRMMKGLDQANAMIAELETKIAGGLEAYGYHPTHVAIENAQQRAFLKAERERIRRRRAKAPKCGWRKQEEADSMLKGSFDGRTIAFDGTETANERLDRLLGVAKQLEHPGIDDAGIETMKDYVQSGRFDHAHYIKIWSDRLGEMGVEFDGLYPLPNPETEPESEPGSEPEPEPEQQPGVEPEPEPELEPEQQEQSDDMVKATDMTIVFTGTESDEARLNKLLAKATELEHPGIDPEGIETMKGFISAGRFPHSHYIKMWTKRLEDMNVKIYTETTAANAQLSTVDTAGVAKVPPQSSESGPAPPELEPNLPASPRPAETPPTASTQAVEMEIVFTDAQGEEERLNKLLAKAMELEHPGIDQEGIETMKGFIQAGRFPHSHYIKMWTKRLEDMGVEIVQVTEPDMSRLDTSTVAEHATNGPAHTTADDVQADHVSTGAETPAPGAEPLPNALQVDVSPISNEIARPGSNEQTDHGVEASVEQEENFTPMRAEALRLGTELDNVSV